MPVRTIARRLCLVLLGLVFLSGSNCSSNQKPLSSPTAMTGTTGNPNGGPGAPPSAMTGNASILANLVMDYRQRAGRSPVSASNVLAGVAQAQADDMAANNYVGLVDSDGEDVFQRLANSGYADAVAGVIADGYSTDPVAVYEAMLTNESADATLLENNAFNSIGVGYSNGYWMVILGTATAAPTGTTTGAGLQIATASLPDWTVNLSGYNQTITATGGTGTVTFAAGAGVPPGLSLGSAGALTGTPTTTGTYNFTVTASDSVGATASKSYTVTINATNPAVTIVTTTLATWDASLSGYNQTITATGGTGTITFTAGTGVPTGLSLGSAGGLTGTPSAAGTFNFTVTATDSVGTTATQSFTLLINPAVTIVTTTVPNGTVGQAYSAPITTAGGTGAITLSLASGSLPGGITLNGSGGSGASTSTFVTGGGLNHPVGLAFDSSGNLYAANLSGGTITKATPAGVTSTFASGLSGPQYLAFDTAGNLYAVNQGNNTVTKTTPAGVTSTFLGAGGGLSTPIGLAFDAAANLYVVNQGNNTITKITPAGVPSTFLTGGGLNNPQSMAFDSAGNLYVSNYGNSSITKVTPAAVASTFATGGGLSGPEGLAFDTAGNLYVVNNSSNTISLVTPAGVISNVAGPAGFNGPVGLAIDSAGNLYAPNWNNNSITKVTLGNTALSGTPTAAGTFIFTVTATDTLGSTASKSYTVTISP